MRFLDIVENGRNNSYFIDFLTSIKWIARLTRLWNNVSQATTKSGWKHAIHNVEPCLEQFNEEK